MLQMTTRHHRYPFLHMAPAALRILAGVALAVAAVALFAGLRAADSVAGAVGALVGVILIFGIPAFLALAAADVLDLQVELRDRVDRLEDGDHR
jgi:hypothetical protein